MSAPRTLRRRLEDFLVHPAVSVLLAVLGVCLFALGEAVVHPVRKRVEEEKKKLQKQSLYWTPLLWKRSHIIVYALLLTIATLPLIGELNPDFVSCGALTHAASWADIGLDWA